MKGGENTQVTRKKAYAGIAVLILTALSILTVWALTWSWSTITMTASTGEFMAFGQFQDCLATVPVTSHSWGALAQGQTYEMAVYVKNTGNKGIYLTYSPMHLYFYNNQAHFTLKCWIIEFGLPCQLNSVDPTVVVWERNVNSPTSGYWLDPGKVVKINVELWVETLVAGGTYSFDLTFYGATT